VTLFWIAVACLRDPVLVGVEPRAPSSDDADDETAPYERGPGVQVDCVHLTGGPWEAARDEVAKQLGDIVAIEDLGEDGRRIELTGGELRELDGTVYQARFELEAPLRRSAALAAAGLSTPVDRWYGTHREWLVRWTGGFARLRLGKQADDAELVTWVECSRWLPKDQRRR